MNRVYVASSLKNWRRVREVTAALLRLGVSTTYDWTAVAADYELGATATEPELRGHAERELAGVLSCRCLLAVWPGRHGTHFEMGVAYASGIPIVLLAEGPEAYTPTSFHYLRGVSIASRESEAYAEVLKLIGKSDRD